MTKTVVAIFNSMDEAQEASSQLLSNGFSSDNIDVSSGENYSGNSSDHDEENGITRFFKNLFGNNDDERERYTKVAGRGNIVTVYAQSDEEAERVRELLDDYGAVDVDEKYRNQFSGVTSDNRDFDNANENYGTTNRAYNTSDDTFNDKVENYEDRDNLSDLNENKTIPVIKEDINIGKKEVSTGGMRIRSRIIEKPVEENLRLREEYVRVERNKVNRPATEDELKNFRNETVELRGHAEIPDVQKTSNVVEEVSLRKEVKHRDETIHDTVTNTEVDVENIGDDNIEHDPRNSGNMN